MENYTIKLLEKHQIADNVIEMKFEKPETLDFESGQFMQFLIPKDGKKTARSYSIASTPSDKYLEFCVKLHKKGLASEFFNEMQLGDQVEIKGPLGRFTCHDKEMSALFLIATGAGLAPIMGIIRDQLENRGSKIKINLLFGVRSEKDIFWNDRLSLLEEKYSNFSYQICLSQPTGDWGGNCGRVTEHMKDIDNASHFFLCGSPDMVIQVKEMLAGAKVDQKQIHFEVF